jgi:hypothetical protein
MNTKERQEGSKKEVLLPLLDELSSLLRKAKIHNDLSPKGSSLHNNGYIEIFINDARKYTNTDSFDDAVIDTYIESAQKYITEVNNQMEKPNQSPEPFHIDGSY